LGIFVAILWLSAGPIGRYMKERNRVIYRDAEVNRGRIVAVINATGTIKPVQSVSVGAVVSGPILRLYADFNDEVKKDQMLAKVDPKIYEANRLRDLANVASAKAMLATRQAEVKQVEARLQQAANDEERAKNLQIANKNFISDTEMDKFKYERIALEAQVKVANAAVAQADAAVDQADAGLKQSIANLQYTDIRSPVDGVIIDRKIDEGQSMAAQFQTPELFIVAPDMRKEMRVFASVDETDIGLIREAQQTGQPVHFTVDAYRDDLFAGTIYQIRKSSTTTQNVVTYPVVISAANPDLKLLPGMTANISFQLREKTDVLRVPNAAIRFYPQREEQVHPDDRVILQNKGPVSGEIEDGAVSRPSAEEKAELRRKRNRRHVWVQEGEYLRAVAVITGLNDNNYTELVSGELREGARLVTGVQTKK
jgi:HlyD family secretion protein